MFYHSLISDWNHGNAHFLRGVVTELVLRGHDVAVYEPKNSWSVSNLIANHGETAIDEFHRAYPHLSSFRYDDDELDFEGVLDSADLVIVHEWNDADLIERIGVYRQLLANFTLLFHDTHHRIASQVQRKPEFNLDDYDGVLAYGQVLADVYEQKGWTRQAWTWHEAADTRVFHPLPDIEQTGDVVWIGNWGDEERSAELQEFLITPVKNLGLDASVYGVRYPSEARRQLRESNIEYRGWLPNFRVPEVFAQFRVTVHIPRRPYVNLLPGIPTIRPFEALACGIPLICSPWEDAEGLFEVGRDFLMARNGGEMERMIREVVNDRSVAKELAAHGLTTIQKRHTCAHRVDELLTICNELTRTKEVSITT